MVKYPNINIPLVGEDGNAFSILARVRTALRQNNLMGEWEAFHTEATAGSYDNLLMTVMKWFSVDQDESDEDEWDSDHCGWCDELHEDCEC